MICPITVTSPNGFGKCCEERCAWWIELPHEKCAIALIPKVGNMIEEDLGEIGNALSHFVENGLYVFGDFQA